MGFFYFRDAISIVIHQSPVMKHIKFLFIVAIICMGYSPAIRAQESFPNKVVRISKPGAANPNEISISINPKNPKQIVAVSMQRKFPDGSTGITNYNYYSDDGGLTWSTVPVKNPEHRTNGDDAIAYGINGMAYHSFISFQGIYSPHPEKASTGIFVSSTKNNGKSWSHPVPVVDHLNVDFPFEDKPYPVADNNPNSAYKNHLYITWTHFDKYGSKNPADSSQIFFSRSVNNGKTFSMPVRISDTGGDCRDSSNTVEGSRSQHRYRRTGLRSLGRYR